ncbi:phage tail protein [Haemophilus haemolyticus]|uniref:phage tail protein n=1 Tax=Haemophilus haemolyticus TaxID=726 RepID=UPI001865209F|nr:phage tail protein [Haemophilus haemolyticus]
MKTLLPEIDSPDKRFHAGNPATGEQGTRVTDTWLNDVQDCVRDVQAEAHYVLLKAGFTPRAETQTQLYQAIVKIIDDNRKSASITQKGEVRLTSDTGLDSEELGLTAKAGKVLAQGLAALRLALNNYIPNNKKNSRVDSDSTDDVATPKAVKTAYEKAVAAENLAKTKWTAKAATETTAGILPISHKTDGTAKDKFASEFAVGEKADRNHKHEVSDIVDFNNSVTGLIKNVVRKTYQQTKQHKKKIKIRVRKGPGYVYEDGEETINIQTEGTMTVYPNGKIEQIIAFRNFSPTWFGAETNDNALHIPVQLWSSMPNKVDYVTVFLNKTKSGAQYASEATEWILGWAEDIQEQIKDKVTIRAVRWTGGQDEPVDLIIKVEGY